MQVDMKPTRTVLRGTLQLRASNPSHQWEGSWYYGRLPLGPRAIPQKFGGMFTALNRKPRCSKEDLNQSNMWLWLKIKQEGQTAGFGPCFHLPGFHFGTGFWSHSHVGTSTCGPRGLFTFQELWMGAKSINRTTWRPWSKPLSVGISQSSQTLPGFLKKSKWHFAPSTVLKEDTSECMPTSGLLQRDEFDRFRSWWAWAMRAARWRCNKQLLRLGGPTSSGRGDTK